MNSNIFIAALIQLVAEEPVKLHKSVDVVKCSGYLFHIESLAFRPQPSTKFNIFIAALIQFVAKKPVKLYKSGCTLIVRIFVSQKNLSSNLNIYRI